MTKYLKTVISIIGKSLQWIGIGLFVYTLILYYMFRSEPLTLIVFCASEGFVIIGEIIRRLNRKYL